LNADQLADVIRAVALSEEDVADLRIVEKGEDLLACGLYATAKDGIGVLLVHMPRDGKPIRMRLLGEHRVAVLQMLGVALGEETDE
jgi:hypothetical protein